MKFSYSCWLLRILWLALYLSHAFYFRTEAAAYEIYENNMHTKYSGFTVYESLDVFNKTIAGRRRTLLLNTTLFKSVFQAHGRLKDILFECTKQYTELPPSTPALPGAADSWRCSGLPNRFLKKSDTSIIFKYVTSLQLVAMATEISLFARSLQRLAKLACQLLVTWLGSDNLLGLRLRHGYASLRALAMKHRQTFACTCAQLALIFAIFRTEGSSEGQSESEQNIGHSPRNRTSWQPCCCWKRFQANMPSPVKGISMKGMFDWLRHVCQKAISTTVTLWGRCTGTIGVEGERSVHSFVHSNKTNFANNKFHGLSRIYARYLTTEI